MQKEKQVNMPCDPVEDAVYFADAYDPTRQGYALTLSRAELEPYNADPDAFVAAHFGLTKDEYREWVRCDGRALCSERTTSGALCNVDIGPAPHDALEWKRRHRASACSIHRRRLKMAEGRKP
ncbi:hypothetical protein [Methylocystis suflitae]|uniref:hypothetical protein n=1 Tax=Methylocystis suflitae TaxID=2951405 RepID=UPI002109D532|nr:hypothetical protein [Methylocystis suflitae]MCQ4191017.1 hypothetical protein [Methylocystis suflitae]